MGVDVHYNHYISLYVCAFKSLLSELYYSTICRFNTFERICKHTWPVWVKSTKHLLSIIIITVNLSCDMYDVNV